MYKITGRLSDVQKKELITGFLKNLGERLMLKRNVRNISQQELAECLNIDRSTLSKYESGDRNMQVSMLPLFSTYCKFSLRERFPEDESKEILDTFSVAVIITADRRKRRDQSRQKKMGVIAPYGQVEQKRILKGQVYDVDGQEVFEPTVHKQKPKSLREKYKDAEMHTEFSAYSDMEFCDFVKSQNERLKDSVVSAGQFLKQIEELANKETLKGLLADYIVDELVINRVANEHPDEVSRRAYAYYQKLYQEYLSGDNERNEGNEIDDWQCPEKLNLLFIGTILFC